MTFLLSEKKKHRRLKGFSIGEVLLAAFVLTSGLMATSALMATSLHNSFETRDAIIATQLSQEGVELVRNNRDNNFLVSGDDGFENFSNQKHCRVNYNDSASVALDCDGGVGSLSDYVLVYSGNFYQHGSGTGHFSRYLYIDYNSGSDMALVKSFVYWGGGASGMFTPPTSPPDGSVANCTIDKKCVYTEVTLTSWK